MQYPDKVLSFSNGKIISIEGNRIKHSCSTKPGSSGSPIISRNSNSKIIGLHFGCKEYNYFTSINSIINDIIKKSKVLDRITKEYKVIYKNPIANCGITIGLFNDDIRKWKVTNLGPKDTSYKGGLFYLSINFPNDYPSKPPEVCFITPIYHVNVNPKAPTFPGAESLGHICISTLNWWKPEYTMREVLTNIFALFYLVNPESPYDLKTAE